MPLPERFEIKGQHRWLILATPWIFLAFTVLSISLPFLPDDKPGNDTFILWFSVITAMGWALGAWYSFRFVRKLHLTAFTFDADGLWPSALPRDSALVRWADVTAVREKPRLQRLDLLGSDGTVRARLEYQLDGFERARAIVFERAHLATSTTAASDGVYQSSRWHHLFNIGMMFALGALGWFVAATQPIVGYACMVFLVGFIGWEYWTSPYRIRLTAQSLEIDRPLRRQTVPRQLVTRIEMTDDFGNHRRHPCVTVHVMEPGRPIRLRGLSSSAAELFQVLRAWHVQSP